MKKDAESVEEVREFTRVVAHAYNNALFKLNAVNELLNIYIDSNPEKIKEHLDKLKKAIDQVQSQTEILSEFAHTGSIIIDER